MNYPPIKTPGEQTMKVTIDAYPVEESKEEKKEFDKWEIDSAVDCLIRAEEIRANPDLYPLVKEKLTEKSKALQKITSIEGLRKVAKSKGA
jgi:hypothetical protein